ncbi:hypothetical protein [Methanolapillus ohkumae]|uniref:Polymer-forming cytoskeletal protein n=1 Tax=Methanolapillus ohkumae TaxID=3028298 RepID=A0AA96V9M0_9EURY|nr:hypothetical protein MsAm2_16270 [Methanosarcinaceae archaeon Am2]
MTSKPKIRFYPSSNTYVIPKGSFFEDSILIHGNLIAGPGVHFWKNVIVEGNVQLGKGCTLAGNLKAVNVIVGAKSKVGGKITADWNTSVFQNSEIGSIECLGHLVIMNGCVVGYANAEKTMEILGKADIKKIGRVTKVTVRTNEVLPVPEEKDIPAEFENMDDGPSGKMNFEVEAIEIETATAETIATEPVAFETVESETIEIDIKTGAEENSDFEIIEPESLKIEEAEFKIEEANESADTIFADAGGTIGEDETDDAEIISHTESGIVTKTVIETAFGPVTIEDYEYETEVEFDFGLEENGLEKEERSEKETDKNACPKSKFLKHTSQKSKPVEPEDDDAEVYEDEKEKDMTGSYVNFNKKRRAGGAELIYDAERDGNFDPTLPEDEARRIENTHYGTDSRSPKFATKTETVSPAKFKAAPDPFSPATGCVTDKKIYKPYDDGKTRASQPSKQPARIGEIPISELMKKEKEIKKQPAASNDFYRYPPEFSGRSRAGAKTKVQLDETDREDAKKWYEERQSGVSKTSKKEYPPYI